MIKSIRQLAFLLLLFFVSQSLFAQSTTISGNVRTANEKTGLTGVSVTVKGSSQGTFTNNLGNFSITINQPLPVTLVFSTVGAVTREVEVSAPTTSLVVDLETRYSIGEEIVVSASRAPERMLESPVTIERVNAATIRNSPNTSYYD